MTPNLQIGLEVFLFPLLLRLCKRFFRLHTKLWAHIYMNNSYTKNISHPLLLEAVGPYIWTCILWYIQCYRSVSHIWISCSVTAFDNNPLGRYICNVDAYISTCPTHSELRIFYLNRLTVDLGFVEYSTEVQAAVTMDSPTTLKNRHTHPERVLPLAWQVMVHHDYFPQPQYAVWRTIGVIP